METESNFGFPACRGNPRNDDACPVIVIEPIAADADDDDSVAAAAAASNQNNCVDQRLQHQQQQHQLQQQQQQQLLRHHKMKSILNCQPSNSQILMTALTSSVILPQSSSSSSSPSPSPLSSSSSSSTLPLSPSIPPTLLPQLTASHHLVNQGGIHPQVLVPNPSACNPAPLIKHKLQSILLSPEEIKCRPSSEARGSKPVVGMTANKFGQHKMILCRGAYEGGNPSLPCSIPSVVSANSCNETDDTFIEVVCGDNTAQLNLNRLAKGTKVSCVWFKGTYITPNQFQHASGRATARDWKRSIKHGGSSLKVLMFNKTITLAPARCRCSTCMPNVAGRSTCSGSSSDTTQVFNSSCTSSPGGVNNSQDSNVSCDPRMSTSTDDRDSTCSCLPMDLTFRSKPDPEPESEDDDVDMSDAFIDDYLKNNDPQYADQGPIDLSTRDDSDLGRWRSKVSFMNALGMGESPSGVLNVEKMEHMAKMREKVARFRKIRDKRSRRRSRTISRKTDESTEAASSDAPLDLVLPFKKRHRKDFFGEGTTESCRIGSSGTIGLGSDRSVVGANERRFYKRGSTPNNIGASLSSECYTVDSSYRPRVNKEIFSRDLATKIGYRLNRKRNSHEKTLRLDTISSSPRLSTIPINSHSISTPLLGTTDDPKSLGFNSGFGPNGYALDRHIPIGSSMSRRLPNPSTAESSSSQVEPSSMNLQQHLDIKTSVLKKQLWRSLVANPSASTSGDLPELVTNHISPSPELEAVIKTIMHKMLTEHSYNGLAKSHDTTSSQLATTGASAYGSATTSEQTTTSERGSPNDSRHEYLNFDESDSPPNLVIASSDEADDKFSEPNSASPVLSRFESNIRLKSSSENYLPDLIQSNRVEQEMTIDYSSALKVSESCAMSRECKELDSQTPQCQQGKQTAGGKNRSNQFKD